MENTQREESTHKKIYLPKDIYEHIGEYIVFYSDEENPKILFSSSISEEAYQKAEEIRIERKKTPVVFKVIPKETT